jgi:hypothetical protein
VAGQEKFKNHLTIQDQSIMGQADQFVSPVNLLPELCDIIHEAKEELILVCAFPQLHQHVKRALRSKQECQDLKIIFLYGKYSQGSDFELSKEDLDFLKQLPNIQVIYHSQLHLKFYGNECTSLYTSWNLNHTSANNNIETGIRFSGREHSMALSMKAHIYSILEEGKIKFQSSKRKQSNDLSDSGYHERIAEIQRQHPNAYARWSDIDNQTLEDLFCQGVSVEDLSMIFKRQPSAIRARIGKLELEEKYFYPGLDANRSSFSGVQV